MGQRISRQHIAPSQRALTPSSCYSLHKNAFLSIVARDALKAARRCRCWPDTYFHYISQLCAGIRLLRAAAAGPAHEDTRAVYFWTHMFISRRHDGIGSCFAEALFILIFASVEGKEAAG